MSRYGKWENLTENWEDINYVTWGGWGFSYASNPDAEIVTLLTATPFDDTVESDIGGFPQALGVAALGDPTFTVVGAEVNLRLSDLGFTTEPSDTPSNENYNAVLRSPYSMDQRLFSDQDVQTAATENFGEISVVNDGQFDDWIDYAWDGRSIEISVGTKDDDIANFETVFVGTADGIEMQWGLIVIRLRDRKIIFDRSVQEFVYAGTGDLEGSSDIQGRPKPLAYGDVENVTPIVLDEAVNTYQVHDGPIQDITAVRDRGAALTDAGDFATYAAIKAATTGGAGSGADIEAGEFATCLAEGVFRLGGTPDGDVTADVEGEDDKGGHVNTIGTIVRRIVTTRLGSGSSFTDPDDLDTASFSTFETDNSGVAGIYIATSRSVSEVLQELLGGVSGYWSFTRAGTFFIGQLVDPVSSAGTLTFAARDIRANEIEKLPSPRPSFRRRIGYRRMWTVQTTEDLAGSVSDSDRELYRNEFRTVVAVNNATQSKHRLARDVFSASLFRDEADASSEATRQIDLYGESRNRYTVSVINQLFQVFLGDVVTIDVDRFDLSGGKDLLVIGVEEDMRTQETILELWG